MVEPRVVELKNPLSYKTFFAVRFNNNVYFTTQPLTCSYCGEDKRQMFHNDTGVIYCTAKACKELAPKEGNVTYIRILDDTIKI